MKPIIGENLDSDRQAFNRRVRRGLLLAAEIALALAIVGLLIAIWLPALIGAHWGVR